MGNKEVEVFVLAEGSSYRDTTPVSICLSISWPVFAVALAPWRIGPGNQRQAHTEAAKCSSVYHGKHR